MTSAPSAIAVELDALVLTDLALERQLARLRGEIGLDVATLPYDLTLADRLAERRQAGARLALTSRTDAPEIAAVAARFDPLFETAIIGGEPAVAAWAGGPFSTLTRADSSRRPATLKLWARALRLHQWAKNGLIFLPLLLSGGIGRPMDLLRDALGFLVLGLLASGSYLINDLADLRSDRLHRTKKDRPLASGALPIAGGLGAIVVALALAASLTPLLPVEFAITAMLYLVTTLLYSFALKRQPIVDVLVLALLFTLRIVAGIWIAGSAFSVWLLAFSMFFFLSLACIKRYSECRELAERGLLVAPGRGYRSDDQAWLMTMGGASGACSILVFFIFLTDAASPVRGYTNAAWLWLICAVVGYWLCRVWLLAGRGEMNEDPVLYAVKDRMSLALGGVCVLSIVLAKYA